MTQKLEGKVALVTGSGRGIGRAIALKLAGDGASVVVNDVDEDPAHEVADLIRSAGGRAATCIGTVSSDDFATRFVDTAIREFSGLDIVINNAGYAWDNVIQKASDELWDTMLDVHLTAPFRILRAAQPVIRNFAKQEAAAGQRNVRKVVNISSSAGMFGNAGQSAYSAAKAGLHGLTRTLAKEWGRINVTVNCVAFGLIKTRLLVSTADHAVESIDGHNVRIGVNAELFERLQQQIPLGRAGTPEEGAGAVYMFCIPESDYVSGQILLCGGGIAGI